MTVKGKIKDILKMGHPILHQPTKVVDDIMDPEVQQAIADLWATSAGMERFGGLAAPQIGHPYRIMLFSVPEGRCASGLVLPLTIAVNPILESIGDEMIESWEACYSLPSNIGMVPRYKTVQYRYMTEDGKHQEGIAEGFLAKVLQHETDHLDGILYVERMKDMRRFGDRETVIEHQFPK